MEDRSHILERAAGVVLPADYRWFLNRYDGGARLSNGTMRFSLATAEVLAAPFPFDRPRIDRPLFEAHFIYLSRTRDAGIPVFDGGVSPVVPDHFARMITIGFGERPDALDEGLPPTHVIVLDPGDGSVRLVSIDRPVVVRRVGDSFQEWLVATGGAPKARRARPAKKVSKRKPGAVSSGVARDRVRVQHVIRRSAKARGVAKAAAKPVAKKVQKKPDAMAALLRRERLTLPAAVERRLKSKAAKRQIARADGRLWTLATPEDLADKGFRFCEPPEPKPLPFVRCMRAFADRLKALQATGPAPIVPVVGRPWEKFTLARLRKGVCVGASNGDPLFLDPTDGYSVWTFSQETNTVAFLADRFEAFVKPVRTKKPAPSAEALKRAA